MAARARPQPTEEQLLLTNQRWRLENLYWIKDKSGNEVRFRPNPAQLKLLDELHYLNIILKARQLGFTTFIQLYMLDMAVFYPNTNCGVIAHTLPDAETIFREKIKYAYDRLPEAIRQRVPVKRDNTKELFLANESSIRVGTSLRGGTLNFLHVSEFGKICADHPDRAQEVITGSLQTLASGQMAFIESTAEGAEGAFYDMCQAAREKALAGSKLSPLDWKFHFSAWMADANYSIDPEGVTIPQELKLYFEKLAKAGMQTTAGQRAWYVKKAEVLKDKMQQEFPTTPDEAFAQAIEGTYYTTQLSRASADKRIGRVPFDPLLDVECWWDLGVDDDTAIWFVQRHRREIRLIDFYARNGEGLAHYAGVLRERSQERGYRYSRHVMPHDIEVRELSANGATRREAAEKMGIKPIVVAPKIEVADGIEAVRNILARCYFDEEHCAAGLKALRHYRKEWNDKRSVWSSKPRHDDNSHAADAFRYGAITREPIGRDDSAPKPKNYALA